MRNGTICVQVLIFFTNPFQSHMDKMQAKKHQSKGDLALDLQGLHDLRAVPSFWASISPSVQVGETQGSGNIPIHQGMGRGIMHWRSAL